MFKFVQNVLFCATESELRRYEPKLLTAAQRLARRAFESHEPEALLEAHRTLYTIHLAHLMVPWQTPLRNLNHPLVARVRYCLQTACDLAEEHAAARELGPLPSVHDFSDWIVQVVRKHRAHPIHPVFHYLRDCATKAQLREFLFQETPLEMLFGDIIACMLPGVYGPIKTELVKNYWDEVGRAREERVHRNLRARLMHSAGIAEDAHVSSIEKFAVEELALVNMYLGMAFDRTRLTQLIGVMLATELVIPGRFEFLIKGWLRVGLDPHSIEYLTEHTTVDEQHAQDWLHSVVATVLAQNPASMSDIATGVMRRLNNAYAVSEALHRTVVSMETGESALQLSSRTPRPIREQSYVAAARAPLHRGSELPNW